MGERQAFRILIADDMLLTMIEDEDVRVDQLKDYVGARLKPILADAPGGPVNVEVQFAGSPAALSKALKEEVWDFIALDNHWPSDDEMGMRTADELRRQPDGPNHNAPVVIFSRHSWLDHPQRYDRLFDLARPASALGSFIDFFSKPDERSFDLQPNEWMARFAADLLLAMKRCFRLRELTREIEELRGWLDERVGSTSILGKSPRLQAVLDTLGKAAPTNTTVLIEGETGTGKELVAKALHAYSPRKKKPFVAINCAALSDNTLESELFGHVRGAFTGADRDRMGRFEYANGGTLFLDEVGDVPKSMQVKLLRVLEENEIVRMGANEPIKVDVRLISATNRDLGEAIADGTFRRDLYHRIKVVSLKLPPLRERREDIPLLVTHFVKDFNEKHNRGVREVSDSLLKALAEYDWPGNIREIRNLIERMVVVDTDGILTHDDLEYGDLSGGVQQVLNGLEDVYLPQDDQLAPYLGEVERRHILKILRKYGSQKDAARALGIAASALNTKLMKYGVRPKDAKEQ